MDFKTILQGLKTSLLLTSEERSLTESLSNEYAEWVKSLSIKERYLIKKYTLNSHDDTKPNRFFERLNRTMRGDYKGSDKIKLYNYGTIISNAICKHPISQRIVCYRGVDDDLLNGVSIGTIFQFDQFISTSVIESGALKKKFKYVIVTPEGTMGAYIENISSFKGQYEFLLDYQCKYKLVAKSGRVIYLEVVI